MLIQEETAIAGCGLRIMSNRNNNNNTFTTTTETLQAAIQDIILQWAEDEVFRIGREVGRQLRWGELECYSPILDELSPDLEVVDQPGLDVFGQPLSKKYNFECECPRCHRTLAAVRFAPHLEKCMGMGRNSSRIASRRLAATASSGTSVSNNGNGSNSSCGSDTSKNPSQGAGATSVAQVQQNGELPSEDEHFEEDEDDEDWTMERKRKKKVVDKISPRRKGPLQRVKNTEGGRGRRGVSPSVTGSPSSIADTSLHGDEDFTSLSLG